MNASGSSSSTTARELGRAFDRSFGEPRRPEAPPSDDFLGVRVGRDPYAIRLSEVAGLFADTRITPLPSRAHGLIGMAGFRGRIVPVYDLHALLGGPLSAAPRWLVIAAGLPVALAFDGCDGHLRLAVADIAVEANSESSTGRIREVARAPDCVRPIIAISAVLDVIRNRVAQTTPQSER